MPCRAVDGASEALGPTAEGQNAPALRMCIMHLPAACSLQPPPRLAGGRDKIQAACSLQCMPRSLQGWRELCMLALACSRPPPPPPRLAGGRGKIKAACNACLAACKLACSGCCACACVCARVRVPPFRTHTSTQGLRYIIYHGGQLRRRGDSHGPGAMPKRHTRKPRRPHIVELRPEGTGASATTGVAAQRRVDVGALRPQFRGVCSSRHVGVMLGQGLWESTLCQFSARPFRLWPSDRYPTCLCLCVHAPTHEFMHGMCAYMHVCIHACLRMCTCMCARASFRNLSQLHRV